MKLDPHKLQDMFLYGLAPHFQAQPKYQASQRLEMSYPSESAVTLSSAKNKTMVDAEVASQVGKTEDHAQKILQGLWTTAANSLGVGRDVELNLELRGRQHHLTLDKVLQAHKDLGFVPSWWNLNTSPDSDSVSIYYTHPEAVGDAYRFHYTDGEGADDAHEHFEQELKEKLGIRLKNRPAPRSPAPEASPAPTPPSTAAKLSRLWSKTRC